MTEKKHTRTRRKGKRHSRTKRPAPPPPLAEVLDREVEGHLARLSEEVDELLEPHVGREGKERVAPRPSRPGATRSRR